MVKKIKLLSIGILTVALLVSCAPVTCPQNCDPQRLMNVSGSGQVTLVPDIAYINIGVRTEADDVSTALSGNTAQAADISDKFVALGVEEKDIQTTSFNVYPTQKYDIKGEVSETTYVVENTIYVTVRDLTQLGKLLDTAVKAGANNIYGISFDVEDKTAAVEQARELAIQDARAKAESIATAAGVSLGELQNINVYSSGGASPYPVARGGGMDMAYAEVPVSAGTLVITVEASLTYEIK
ncbi:MAG: SIMPL domain-containing protein [Chloroflexota bacterium]